MVYDYPVNLESCHVLQFDSRKGKKESKVQKSGNKNPNVFGKCQDYKGAFIIIAQDN